MSELKQIVAERLKECRARKGWTHEQTATLLTEQSGERSTSSRYSNWELALRMPAPEQIIQLAALFGVAPAWLQGFTDNDSTGAVSKDYVTANAPSITTKGGLLTLTQASDATAYSLRYLEKRGLNKNQLLAVRQIDGSMRGVVEEGDEVLLDRERCEVVGADLFGIVVNGSIWIRWIRPQIGDGFIIAAEDKAQYPDQQLTADQFANIDIVGRVARISHDR